MAISKTQWLLSGFLLHQFYSELWGPLNSTPLQRLLKNLSEGARKEEACGEDQTPACRKFQACFCDMYGFIPGRPNEVNISTSTTLAFCCLSDMFTLKSMKCAAAWSLKCAHRNYTELCGWDCQGSSKSSATPKAVVLWGLMWQWCWLLDSSG